ncbi:MAG TPA: DUF6428 family protein [Mucilaginibacter sp.]|nr:DUF6428 family protein [Mucilaginibacter sp.]
MNTILNDQVKWSEFKEIMLQNTGLDLQFQYADERKVAASYHITEIKQAPVTSVDCGGVMNAWTEIIVQLYEPKGGTQLRPMKTRKALSIIDVVEKKLRLNPAGIVKIEFGNDSFDTRQMYPHQFITNDEELIIDLRPDTVQCKAIERGGSCGTPSEKQKTELKNLATQEACCHPGWRLLLI